MKLHQNIYQDMALKLKEGTGTDCFYPALLGGKLPLPGFCTSCTPAAWHLIFGLPHPSNRRY